MSVLYALWCVVETSIVPDYHRWYTLGYFIHPLLLVGCQFYLFGKFVLLRVSFCLSFPVRAAWHANLWLCSSTRRCIYRLVILSGLDDDSIIRQYGAKEIEDRWSLEFGVDDPLTAMVLRESCAEKISAAKIPSVEDQELVGVYSYYYVDEVGEESGNEFFSDNEQEYERVAHVYREEDGPEKKDQKVQARQDVGAQQMQGFFEEVQEGDMYVKRKDPTQQQQKLVQGYQEEKINNEEKIGAHGQDCTLSQPQQPQQRNTVQNYNEKGGEEGERIIDHTYGGRDPETTSRSAVNIAAEVVQGSDTIPADIDEVLMNYTRKMNYLDQRKKDLLEYLKIILDIRAEDQDFLLDIESRIKSLAPDRYPSYPNTSAKLLFRNIISGLELVYVGQACLSWEALQQQYHIVNLTRSLPGAVFHGDIAKKFQVFSTFLERFVEDDRLDGKWIWNYIQGRHSSQNLLRVPEVSGYIEATDGTRNEATTRAEQLLKLIDKAISTFYDFILAINKKKLSKLKDIYGHDQQVENPNDICLFDRLHKEVSKKKRHLQEFAKGKKHFWGKRTAHFRDGEKKAILFSMIDIELASRVLKMFVISTKQLKWCEEKSQGVQLHLAQGQLLRRSTGSSFPVM